MISRRAIVLGAFLLIWADCGYARQADRPVIESGEVTVITSESLVYDSENQSAVFETDVLVTDPDMKLQADKLMVKFDEDNQINYIQADGNVYIEQADKKAWSESASYDLESGKVVLVGDPLIQQGRDMLQGDRITFWRDESRMVCEPNARLIINNQSTQVRSQLEGEK